MFGVTRRDAAAGSGDGARAAVGMKPIQVLVVDDSAAVREALSQIINDEADMQVMATAADPFRAAAALKTAVPDVITLDVEMPQMDGLTFLRRLMAQHPIPVVMCSSLVEPNSPTLHAALSAGAVDVICKPKMGLRGFLEESKIAIGDAIRGAAQARPQRALRTARPVADTARQAAPAPTRGAMLKTTDKVVAIGASTGGTEALRTVLEQMPPDCPPIAIVQHMPTEFTCAFAQRLDELCAISVREASDGDRLLRGQALIAPGSRHMMVMRRGAQYGVEVRDGPLVSRHRPSVDVLFRSVARSAGANAVGIIMTGMGDDGATGLGEMRSAGAETLGQNEESSVVYGMPRAAFERGAVGQQVGLQAIPGAILKLADGR